MSLILDALRKSEAERRRGQLPALALELPPAAPRSARPGAWWLAIPIICLVAAAFWFFRPNHAPADQPSPAQAAPSAPEDHAADAVPQPTAGADVAGEGFERAMDGARPPLVAGRGLMAANPSPAAAAPPPEAENPAPAPASTAPAHERPILALADLTPAERTALPALKLTMHMWSQDPARRFVILDGHRLGEGSRASNAVIERIEPDGVILAADGQRIRLPLP